jgi:hypothetical protein
MRLALARNGETTFFFSTDPVRIGHAPIASDGSSVRALAPGASAAGAPEVERRYLAPWFVTQPTDFVAGQPLSHPGPKVTTMLGLSDTMAGPVLSIAAGTTPMGLRYGERETSYGFAHTTGSVIVQQTVASGGSDFFTLMGSDARTALGAGNISLVAGGLVASTAIGGTEVRAGFHRVRLTLSAPAPSLGPTGLAAAASLMLLGAGRALARRAQTIGPNQWVQRSIRKRLSMPTKEASIAVRESDQRGASGSSSSR